MKKLLLSGLVFFLLAGMSVNGQKLFKAYEKGDLQRFRELVTDNPKGADCYNKEGTPLLVYLTDKKAMPFIDILLNNGADVNICDFTDLHYAAMNGSSAIVEKLVEKKASINIKTSTGFNAIMLASYATNNLSLMKFLVEKGSDLTVKTENGRNIVHFCVINNNDYTVFDYLGEKGAAFDVKDDLGNTPLHYACGAEYRTEPYKRLDEENIDVVKTLVKWKAPVNIKNAKGMTPLQYTCKEGFIKSFWFLLDNGVKIDETDGKGFTALFYACRNGRIPLMTELIKRGADIRHESEKVLTPWMMAIAFEDNTDAIDFMMKQGITIDEVTSENFTGLMFACLTLNEKSVRFLLDKGANTKIKDKDNLTAYDYYLAQSSKESKYFPSDLSRQLR
ncbi:MAG: ankyrin repeat domain-containing protein [Bacteroidetes bacterium]|nr:ankyrin repeat domain-containing protein [Bacteroidota bacterium]